MSDLPEEFKCTITNWDYIYDLCREVSDDVERLVLIDAAGYPELIQRPEVIDRVYDDAERHVLTSTGRHMSRVRAMVRSAQKYQLR